MKIRSSTQQACPSICPSVVAVHTKNAIFPKIKQFRARKSRDGLYKEHIHKVEEIKTPDFKVSIVFKVK